MYADDLDAMAHDLYEIYLYEQIRSTNPNLTPAEVAMKVIGALHATK